METIAHTDQKTLIVHLTPLVLLGFGAVLLDMFNLPPAFECRSKLSALNISGTVSIRESIHKYDLTIAYALVKGLYIAVQVNACTCNRINEINAVLKLLSPRSLCDKERDDCSCHVLLKNSGHGIYT